MIILMDSPLKDTLSSRVRDLFERASRVYETRTMRGFENFRKTIQPPVYSLEQVAFLDCLYEALSEANGNVHTRVQVAPLPESLFEEALRRFDAQRKSVTA